MVKIIIVDDHELFRTGIKQVLETTGNYEIIGEVSNGKELLEMLKYVKPEVILMDINMPEMNGIETTKILIKEYPDIKILIVSMYDDPEYYNVLVDLGVKGFVLKDSNISDLKKAIETLLNGKEFFSQSLLMNLLSKKKIVSTIQFTEREQEVLQLIAKGYTTEEIANTLFITLKTVEKHRSSLLLKTNSGNSLKLLIFAIKNNLVKL